MWQKVTRGLGKVLSLRKNISALDIHEEDSERKTYIVKEIFIWRAVLRKSHYLKSYRDTEYIYSIRVKRLIGGMIDLSGN